MFLSLKKKSKEYYNLNICNFISKLDRKNLNIYKMHYLILLFFINKTSLVQLLLTSFLLLFLLFKIYDIKTHIFLWLKKILQKRIYLQIENKYIHVAHTSLSSCVILTWKHLHNCSLANKTNSARNIVLINCFNITCKSISLIFCTINISFGSIVPVTIHPPFWISR